MLYHKKNMTRKREEKQTVKKLTPEEMIYAAADDLAGVMGISYSEALGVTLGVKNPTYGWENEISEAEFQDLIRKTLNQYDWSDDLPF